MDRNISTVLVYLFALAVAGCPGDGGEGEQDHELDTDSPSDTSSRADARPDTSDRDSERVSDGSVDGGSPSSCATTRKPLLPKEGADEPRVEVGDLDGDGAVDTATLVDRGENRYGLELSTGATVGLADEPGRGWVVMGTDLDADGSDDLVVGDAWATEVGVFFGPVDASRDWSESDVVFRGQPDDFGGLNNQFGATVTAVDADRDGRRDLVVTAPGEQEEACQGQDPPAVFLGPFADARYDRKNADFELGGPSAVCLGVRSACGEGHLKLYPHETDEGDCFAYEYPLMSSQEPTECSE
jgi:hypothetical protein